MGKHRSVAGIAVRAGTVLVGKRKAGGAIGLLWEFPGGKVEPGESDEQALIREFLEEFDISIQPVRKLGESSFVNRHGESELAAWVVALPETMLEDLSAITLHEHIQLTWVSREELAALPMPESDRSLIESLKERFSELFH
ncbi:MAG: (deoxy)nucleoside triphosphate pyrophosphohydrolase [Spirochaetia bacterium]|nr:(deoxy)nucleoside triphosphate pyrophosphohydrolase [Spirochaetia bacterium]